MATAAPLKKDLLSALADEILHSYSKGRVAVAVDGVDGAGKSHFADALAVTLRKAGHPVFRASIDDFHRPRSLRWARGRDSAEGFYRDSFDYALFRRVLIEPFRIGHIGSFVLAGFDLERDRPTLPTWSSGPDDAILVIDGIFLHRPELRGLWNYSIWLDVDAEVAAERLRMRDGETSNVARYLGGQSLYLREANPRAAATAIVDNNDFEHPRRVFADSC